MRPRRCCSHRRLPRPIVLRHRDPRLTANVYGHLAPDFLHQEVSKLQLLAPEHQENLLPAAAAIRADRAARGLGRRKAAGAF